MASNLIAMASNLVPFSTNLNPLGASSRMLPKLHQLLERQAPPSERVDGLIYVVFQYVSK